MEGVFTCQETVKIRGYRHQDEFVAIVLQRIMRPRRRKTLNRIKGTTLTPCSEARTISLSEFGLLGCGNKDAHLFSAINVDEGGGFDDSFSE